MSTLDTTPRCPRCGHEIAGLPADLDLDPGEVLICVECPGLLRLTPERTLRMLTRSEEAAARNRSPFVAILGRALDSARAERGLTGPPGSHTPRQPARPPRGRKPPG